MIEDGDIRNPWPLTTAFDDDETAMAIHVKTCQLLGKLTNRESPLWAVNTASNERF